ALRAAHRVYSRSAGRWPDLGENLRMPLFEFLETLLKGGSDVAPGMGDTESVRTIAVLLEGISPERARFLAAFAYLMARVAHADFHVSSEELDRIRETLQVRAQLPASQAEAVAELARRQTVHEGSTEDFLVTREFRRIATREEMLQLLDCLFAVAASHHSISVIEDNTIRQIASELNLEHREFIAIRSNYKDQLAVFQLDPPTMQ
ncbi:MAG: TerB family tellurite resistance protein, partial [Bryobacterales bacterium]|nr:TerB family tellurite resistance protein [Bryobacterales bacterium]